MIARSSRSSSDAARRLARVPRWWSDPASPSACDISRIVRLPSAVVAPDSADRSGPRVALAPDPVVPWLVAAIEQGGGTVVPLDESHGIVWSDPRDPDGLRRAITEAPENRWIQLPFAGIEPFVPLLDADRTWTCGKGVYADPVAEHALALGLAGLRGVGRYARSATWTGPVGTNLLGGSVTVLGGGGITESLVGLLAPWRCRITVVRRSRTSMPGVDEVVGLDDLHGALRGADLVVLALALTPETEGVIDRAALDAMEPHGWLVNVARGRHVVVDDLVEALEAGRIGGAALDVTDPEPLPDGHPLWRLPNCIITPHVGNTPDMARPLLAARITENVRRFGVGEELIGLVDPEAGY